jgi:SAM-dependent methyltransferase
LWWRRHARVGHPERPDGYLALSSVREDDRAMPDVWSDGAGYESYVGRWSRGVAREFLHWLAVPAGAAWLDFGCGTGALSLAIVTERSPRRVIGCDRSAGYLTFARRQTRDARAEFLVTELPDLPRIDGGFDAAVAGLVLNFLATPAQGVAAMAARVRTGGTVAAYVWDYAEGMQLMRMFWDCAIALDAAARGLDEGIRFPLCHVDPLRDLFRGADLQDVAVRPIVVPTVFRDFDDYWTPFLTGQGPAPGYVTSLSSERRARLRDTIRQRLPISPDGTIRLSAQAWAVRGRRA